MPTDPCVLSPSWLHVHSPLFSEVPNLYNRSWHWANYKIGASRPGFFSYSKPLYTLSNFCGIITIYSALALLRSLCRQLDRLARTSSPFSLSIFLTKSPYFSSKFYEVCVVNDFQRITFLASLLIAVFPHLSRLNNQQYLSRLRNHSLWHRVCSPCFSQSASFSFSTFLVRHRHTPRCFAAICVLIYI